MAFAVAPFAGVLQLSGKGEANSSRSQSCCVCWSLQFQPLHPPSHSQSSCDFPNPSHVPFQAFTSAGLLCLKQSVATGRICSDCQIILCGVALFSNINDCINNKITSYRSARCNSLLIPDLLML